MLTKPPYPNLKQFITALKNHEQTVMSHRQEEIEFTSRNQAFLGQRGRGRKPLGGRHGGQRREFNFSNNNPKTHKHQAAPKTSNTDTKKNEEAIIVCQICFKRGHSAAECWDRYKYDQDEIPQAFTAINRNNTTFDQSIYADSGATSHMVNNPGKLDTITSYKGHDKIIVGNGQ